jgi:hypothetical protein
VSAADEAAWAADVRERLYPGLRQSALFLSIGGGGPDPKAALELGAAIYLDKPILILVPPGETIPAAMRRAADLVLDDVDMDDPEDRARVGRAIDRLARQARERLEPEGQP